MGFLHLVAKQSLSDLFLITFGLLAIFIVCIVAWSDVGGSKMIWILVGSAVGGFLAVGAGVYARKETKGGYAPRPYGY